MTVTRWKRSQETVCAASRLQGCEGKLCRTIYPLFAEVSLHCAMLHRTASFQLLSDFDGSRLDAGETTG